MKSVYWVITHECTQACMHCYNNSGPKKESLSLDVADRIIKNLPPTLQYVILSGGEVLAVPELLFHVLDRLHKKYGDALSITIQTNTDLLDPEVLDRLVRHHVRRIDVTAFDSLHYFRRESLSQRVNKIKALFEDHKLNPVPPDSFCTKVEGSNKPCYSFSGSTEPYYLGTIWPRGRAERNRIRALSPVVNICAGRAGAKGFLDAKEIDEVSIQLTQVFPCWPMTKFSLGDASLEPVLPMVERVRGNPVFEALNKGRPQDMGVSMGITTEYAEKRINALGGVCRWCDEFFTKHYTA